MYRERDEEQQGLDLRHEAVRPARKGFLREHVFAGRWRELMASKPRLLNRVLSDYLAGVGQREATVAASLITWLGTNMGQALIEEAARRVRVAGAGADVPPYAVSDAYLCAWTSENRRKLGVDNGWRTLEALLTEDAAEKRVQPSAADYEVAEHVVFWLGQFEGQRFVQLCQAEVSALAKIESYAGFCRTGHQDLDFVQQKRAELPALASAGEVAAGALRDLEATYGPIAA